MKKTCAAALFVWARDVLFFVITMACAGSLAAQSASLEILQSFHGPANGLNSAAPLVQGTDGYFYGTTQYGGNSNSGTVFRITSAGVLTTLYAFTSADGYDPQAGLTLGSDGNFYGTTDSGGSHSYGTIFEITPSGTLTTLYNFTGGADEGSPDAGVARGSDGNFYGTTSGVGRELPGTVFKITPAGVFTILYTFTGAADGENPEGLVQGADGNFYGTTQLGGNSNGGTVFKITSAGVLTTIYTFTGAADGANPLTGLTLGNDGNFYGITDSTVFRITPAGVLSVICNFNGANFPSGLIQGADGNFYGTTQQSDDNSGAGTIFKITPTGVFSTIYNFIGGASGAQPEAGLTQGNDGNFYGTTFTGGDNSGDGTVFKITPTGVFSTIYNFIGGAPGATVLTLGSDGDFYGTTPGGDGSNGDGTVFKVTPAGILTTLYAFTGGADGAEPEAGLAQGPDGNFYGTTFGDIIGAGTVGTVFKVTPAGVLTTLYTFTGGADGANPEAGLTQGSDGNFYGTTFGGGDNFGDGTVFKVTPAGVLTTLYTFAGSTDGANPEAGLTQGSDGNFYGTTFGGGDGFQEGTVFKVTPAGVLTTLHIFAGETDGSNPAAGLTQGSDGNFYGTTESGGSSSQGTVFKITPSGAFTSLYSFAGAADGASPEAGLIQGNDGNFYGTTEGGGDGSSKAFEITSTGIFTTLYTFSDIDGNNPLVSLTLGSDGNLYGTTGEGGQYNLGGVFRLTPLDVVPPVVTSATASAQVGSAFSLQIVATNSPTSFGASGLPAGLSVNATTGVISGTPTQSGTFPVGLSATNAGGTGSGGLTLTVSAAPVLPPVLTSGAADAQVGSAFSFQIVATNTPTSFGASGLPAGLSVNASAGLISGTPTQSGTFTVELTATNSGGAGTGTLSLTVAPAPAQQPAITLTSPPIDETVVTGSTVPVTASVNDPAGVVSQVQFSLNGSAAGSALTMAPYAATVTAPDPGTYVLQATATDNLGRQSTSSHTLTVIAATADPAAPSAELITDVNGRKLAAGTTIILTCEASTADGSPIQQVNFYANGTLFASVNGNGNPIALSASLPGSGALQRDEAAASSNTLFQAAFNLPISASSAYNQYNLLAIAFSKLGTAQTSSTVTLISVPQNVDQPPKIALAGLTNGQRLTTGSSYTATTVPGQTVARATVASAPADSLSAVAKIEYYLNKLKLLDADVSGGAVPNLTFTAPAPGQYIVEAIATDSAGVASVADPIAVQIDGLPVVSVSVLGNGTAIVGGKKAKVLFSRTGNTSSELKVSYKLAGTAVDGVDYQLAPASRKVVIPAGSASVKLKIEPIADPAAPASLSAKIKLTAPASGAYALGSPSKANITILQH